MSKWQLCPLCQGAGQVSGGYSNRAGDCPTWTSGNAVEVCRICGGRGIIREPEEVKE